MEVIKHEKLMISFMILSYGYHLNRCFKSICGPFADTFFEIKDNEYNNLTLQAQGSIPAASTSNLPTLIDCYPGNVWIKACASCVNVIL